MNVDTPAKRGFSSALTGLGNGSASCLAETLRPPFSDMVRTPSVSLRPVCDRYPYGDAELLVQLRTRPPAGSFPLQRSKCGRLPARNRSEYERIRFCRRLWA